ncbi:DUF3306 domain-containing protein [Rhizobacter sp. AJA081-3]|uniref:DUF3306 domain-containing protein n=1 Tax=Rhizobacter sp. AJA081-3 TaxID=2753607 RepID=UPI001ADFFD3B|nr:DUF3306 domain-containing protein [Rhizobacter sp. AJA081-3]QTN24435.1 DUF3306 domain-containing protein [Rhizobacter sp. AJA081-3]
MASEDGGFLSRWARRKAQVREGREPVPTAPVPAPIEAPVAAATPLATEAQLPVAGETAAEPALTLDDVATLTAESDFSRFVAHDVDPTVKNAALKKLFTDPHYNVMDGLDTYIDDYGKPDPLPEGMLRQMVQSQFLGLFDDEKKTDEPAAAAAAPAPTDPKEDAPDEDADLRLQPHHAADAGEPGAGEPGAGEDAAGQP